MPAFSWSLGPSGRPARRPPATPPAAGQATLAVLAFHLTGAERSAASNAAAPGGGAGGSTWAGSKEEWEAGAAEDEVPWSEAELERELEAGVRRWAQPGEPRWEVHLLHEGCEVLALLRALAALTATPTPSGDGLVSDGGARELTPARLTFGEHTGPGAPLGGSGGLHAGFSRKPEGFAWDAWHAFVDGGGRRGGVGGGGGGGDGDGDGVWEAEARRLRDEARRLGEALAFFEERVGTVQVVHRGALRRVDFPMPSLCRAMPPAMRQPFAAPPAEPADDAAAAGVSAAVRERVGRAEAAAAEAEADAEAGAWADAEAEAEAEADEYEGEPTAAAQKRSETAEDVDAMGAARRRLLGLTLRCRALAQQLQYQRSLAHYASLLWWNDRLPLLLLLLLGLAFGLNGLDLFPPPDAPPDAPPDPTVLLLSGLHLGLSSAAAALYVVRFGPVALSSRVLRARAGAAPPAASELRSTHSGGPLPLASVATHLLALHVPVACFLPPLRALQRGRTWWAALLREADSVGTLGVDPRRAPPQPLAVWLFLLRCGMALLGDGMVAALCAQARRGAL